MASVHTRLIALALSAILFGQLGPRVGAQSAAQPATQAVSAQAAPSRIISLIPATTEMLFAMGAGDRIAGVSNYDHYPPQVERLNRVGGLLDPNIERIFSLKPDLVIAYSTQTDLRQELARAHIPVFSYEHRGLPDITQTVRALGDRIGLKDAGERVAGGMERQLAATEARVAGVGRPNTLLVFGHDPGTLRHVDASGGYGFLHDLLELAGGSDILGSLKKQSVELSTEAILSRAPDAILDIHYGAPMTPDRIAAERRIWDALTTIPAVKNGRVFVLVGDEFVVPGPRIVIAADRFARTLHPEAFK